jgi:transcriptional regulator of acetoin/glycerol metabolism
MDVLRALPWPGNVRELRNVLENLLLTSSADVVTVDELPIPSSSRIAPPLMAAVPPSMTSLENAEREAIKTALAQAGGNIASAARRLEISRSTLYRKMERFSLIS